MIGVNTDPTYPSPNGYVFGAGSVATHKPWRCSAGLDQIWLRSWGRHHQYSLGLRPALDGVVLHTMTHCLYIVLGVPLINSINTIN